MPNQSSTIPPCHPYAILAPDMAPPLPIPTSMPPYARLVGHAENTAYSGACTVFWGVILEEISSVPSARLAFTGSISSPRRDGGAFRSSFDIRSRSCSNRKLCEAVSSPDVFPVSVLLVQFAYLWRHGAELRRLAIKKGHIHLQCRSFCDSLKLS
jgi:hypothetical protein